MNKILVAVLAMSIAGCARVTPSAVECNSVPSIISNAAACSGRIVHVKAYLVATRHGAYMADNPDDGFRQVLGVDIIESGPHAAAAAALLEKLDRAQLGHPLATIFGEFEGKIEPNSSGGGLTIMVFREVL